MSKVLANPAIIRPRSEPMPLRQPSGSLAETSSDDLRLALETAVNDLALFPELTIKTFVVRAKLAIRLAATVNGRYDILVELADRGQLHPEDVNHVALADGVAVSSPCYHDILTEADQQSAERKDVSAVAAYLAFMAESDALGIAN